MQEAKDDIASQARQGSVAAIIEILNKQLADARIRTRAIFADGVLQLLCEGALAEQLDRVIVVKQIRQILEGIAPRNISRVRINSRIVQEQQLLWLEEINRNPQHLLWSEEIKLTKPNILQQLTEGFKSQPKERSHKFTLPTVSPRQLRENSRFRRGIISGVSLTVLLLMVGWFLYDYFGLKQNGSLKTQALNSTAGFSPTPTKPPVSSTSVSTASAPSSDPFGDAVRLANQANADGKDAKTAAQWLDLAGKWQKASDLMSEVKPDHPRYQVAQDRVILYRNNSKLAQDEGQKLR
ncbi:hypothetical protein [Limnofasciculus baicalensis]|uniref:Uncharacterized protein n=1 Tax=Limnofasciculus baicalensis BBK-W-15 TaxID=2699891 RepID=A0AAE3GNP7_9CYAN|nr:hypothetical protein [Limnofasciculus baicalensis]MCP2727118.1 hypothetical protein [Limnofasciculus baicalensis BBK-W-15]